MHTEICPYQDADTRCLGFLAYEETKERKPVVLVASPWRGQDDFAKEKAMALAKLGYVGFAVDMYGEGKRAQGNEEAALLMEPLFMDRAFLQQRIGQAVRHAQTLPMVDPHKIGAIGFCFGGLVVYELMRSGAPVAGVVAFHGVYANKRGDKKAKTLPISQKAKAKTLILHGHQDPLVSPEDLMRVQQELTEANIDWQMHIYGHTYHAFTNPQANDQNAGTVYHEANAKRAWHEMVDFFEELF